MRYPVSLRATAMAVVVSTVMVIAPVFAEGEGDDAAATAAAEAKVLANANNPLANCLSIFCQEVAVYNQKYSQTEKEEKER